MIGFDHIGTMGRLGNQMFQYAALKGIAAHRGYEYTIPPENPKIQIDNYGLIEAFELSDNKKIGRVSRAFFSPRLQKNIGLGIVDIDYADELTKFFVSTPHGDLESVVVSMPWFKAEKDTNLG